MAPFAFVVLVLDQHFTPAELLEKLLSLFSSTPLLATLN
jgi:hypothetical protein